MKKIYNYAAKTYKLVIVLKYHDCQYFLKKNYNCCNNIKWKKYWNFEVIEPRLFVL